MITSPKTGNPILVGNVTLNSLEEFSLSSNAGASYNDSMIATILAISHNLRKFTIAPVTSSSFSTLP